MVTANGARRLVGDSCFCVNIAGPKRLDFASRRAADRVRSRWGARAHTTHPLSHNRHIPIRQSAHINHPQPSDSNSDHPSLIMSVVHLQNVEIINPNAAFSGESSPSSKGSLLSAAKAENENGAVTSY